MKIIDRYLRQWLPELKVKPEKIVSALTLTGSFARVIKDDEETIYDIEVGRNRGDVLGYYGVARDLSVYFQTKLSIRAIKPLLAGQGSLPIEIKTDKVKRLIAYRISGLKNKTSPAWLKKFLNLQEINSVNTLVDLTNFMMLWHGVPCHAFDSQKAKRLIWEINQNKYADFTTLDDTKVLLSKDNLVVSDGVKPVSLTFIGSQNSGVELKTTETIVEMAIYDRVQVRRDWRKLKIQTEASVRLEKDLDAELVPPAINHLIHLILANCGGEITGWFDYYPQKIKAPKIKIDWQGASKYAGIKIPEKTAKDILTRLGCQIKNNWVIPPTIRKDLALEEDLIEEILRFYGYDQIPTDQPIAYKKLPNITPKILLKIEKVKRGLVKQGYDEIRSWPLIKEKYLEKNGRKPIYTQNNTNEAYPVLRNSILCSLKQQKEQYDRLKVPGLKFFEIGKIFYQKNGQYQEKSALGTYYQGKYKEIDLEADERG
jgi:phenylalanyl-tRNA synthetase beta chain